MTLQKIRELQTETELVSAVREFVDLSKKMNVGEMLAMRSTIMSAADRLGVPIEKLNRIVEEERNARHHVQES